MKIIYIISEPVYLGHICYFQFLLSNYGLPYPQPSLLLSRYEILCAFLVLFFFQSHIQFFILEPYMLPLLSIKCWSQRYRPQNYLLKLLVSCCRSLQCSTDVQKLNDVIFAPSLSRREAYSDSSSKCRFHEDHLLNFRTGVFGTHLLLSIFIK